MFSQERSCSMKKQTFFFPSSDGTDKIHAVVWKPDRKYASPVGIVQISHGMVEYVERYEDFALFLNQHGFLVAGNDHLGHGLSVKSEEDWGYMTSKHGSRCVVQDLHRLTKIIKKKYPNVPYFLLGHSMGSFLARRYLMEYGQELDGALLLGTGNQPFPMLLSAMAVIWAEKKFFGERYRSQKIQYLMFGAYNRKIPHPQSANDWVTSDAEQLALYNRTPACRFQFTLNGFEVLISTLLYIERKQHICRIPKSLSVLLLAGKEDPVGNYGKSVEKVYRIYKKSGIRDIQCRLFDGCRHELINEVSRQEVYQCILAWLMAHIRAENRT